MAHEGAKPRLCLRKIGCGSRVSENARVCSFDTDYIRRFYSSSNVFEVQILTLSNRENWASCCDKANGCGLGVSTVVFCRVLALAEWAHSKLCSAINAEDDRHQNGAGVH